MFIDLTWIRKKGNCNLKMITVETDSATYNRFILFAILVVL